MNTERLLKLIVGPHISEKGTLVADKAKQIVFKVVKNANKAEIKKAVEQLFNVKVQSVNVLNNKPKSKKFRQIEGQRKSWKKAYVTLASGDINFSGLE
ncbi:MAG: 50S ribosomal protein L23 [Legionellaceae bacterium]